MKRRSTRAVADAEYRRDMKLEMIAARGSSCEACGKTPVGEFPPRPFQDVHEILSRARGGDVRDPANCLLVCRRCHDWITTHPEDATEAGLLRSMTPEEIRLRLHPWHQGEPLGGDADSDTGEGLRAA